jgi:hypothetical protein
MPGPQEFQFAEVNQVAMSMSVSKMLTLYVAKPVIRNLDASKSAEKKYRKIMAIAMIVMVAAESPSVPYILILLSEVRFRVPLLVCPANASPGEKLRES